MKNKKQVINYITILILLLLSAINLNNYFMPKKVLGIRVEERENSNIEFWNEFLKSNPKYLPGYMETGELEYVEKLDPNFIP